MKAAVYYGKHDVRIEEIPVPVPRAGEVLIKVRACGVCGTDVHIFNGDEGAAKCPPGTVLGHEFSGEIVSAGTGVKTAKIGDRVCVDPNRLCGRCGYCRAGIGHFCTDIVGIGTTVNGGFAEYCAVPESQIYPFPETLSFERAAMTEPVSCCLHGIELCRIECGGTAAVIGCGMIGLLMIQLAKLSGAAKVIAFEPQAEKRAQAASLGADIVLDPRQPGAEEAAADCGRISAVIECVGKPQTIEQAIRIAGKYSTVMMFGLTSPDAVISVKPFEFFRKEITLRASFINPYTQQRALNLISSGRIDVSSMVQPPIPLSGLPEALADPARRAAGKLIVIPAGPQES